MTRTIATETESLDLTPFKTCTSIRELAYTKSEIPCTIPAGTELVIFWSRNQPGRVYFDFEGRMRSVNSARMFDTFNGKFIKEPGVSTLERWSNEGFCKTVTGKVTEPDGTGTDGSPSWLLILGMI